MIYRKDWNDRSPLRVFEKSIHGGLGRGNIGVVMSRAGVGKTAFLVGVALDDLLRGRKVLHVAQGDSVDHIRNFYDEVFLVLNDSNPFNDVQEARLLMERCRMIHTYADGNFSLEKMRRSVHFLKEHANFQAEVAIVDGYDVESSTEADWTLLKQFAKEENVELWLSALTHRESTVTNTKGIPNPVARFDAWVSVMVELQPAKEVVTIQLLKDHENENLEDLNMKLDPNTLLLLTGEK